MPEATGSVPGPRGEHHAIFYGLSTCVWCRRTRQFLEDQGVKFDYVYVDLLKGQEREEAMKQVRCWNPVNVMGVLQEPERVIRSLQAGARRTAGGVYLP